MPTKAAVRKFGTAVSKGKLHEVRSLLEQDALLVNAPYVAPPKKHDGQSPLQLSLKAGAFDVASLLIDAGADVNFMEVETVNEWRAPVLHDAIMACVMTNDAASSRGVLRRMLALGADANRRDSYGNSPLGRAMLDAKRIIHLTERWARPPGIFADLLEFGADRFATCDERPAVDDDSRGYQAYRFLVQALGGADDWRSHVWADRPERLEDPNVADPEGRTPLLTAAIFGSERTLEQLRRSGVDVNARDHAGWTALGLAWWSLPISKALLEHGANPNLVQGRSGRTPFSSNFHRTEFAELMLAYGADPNTKGPEGKTYEEVRSERAR